VPTVLDQIRMFVASGESSPSGSLFIVEGGANDFLVEVLTGGVPWKVPAPATANLMTGVALLHP